MPRNMKQVRKYYSTYRFPKGKEPLTKKVSKLTTKVNRLEDKFHHDVAINQTEVLTTAQFFLLNGVAQGDSDETRTGAQVYWLNLDMRLRMIADIDDDFNQVRMILLQDRQPNGVVPAVAEVLENVSFPITSPFNFTSQKRFRILNDRVMSINEQDTPSKFVHIKRKLNIRTQYIDNTATVAGIQTNSIYLMLISSENTSTEGPKVSGYVRSQWKD